MKTLPDEYLHEIKTSINSLSPSRYESRFIFAVLQHILIIHLEHFLWKSRQVIAKRAHWWLVNVGLGDSLVLFDNNPLPMRIDQSHRYWRHQAACREPAGCYDKTTQTAICMICFEHKTQDLLIRAPYTRIVVFWHISNIPPMISQSQISCTVKHVYNDHLYNEMYYLWFIQ